MNSEIKQKWVDALRSGKYQQGKGCLRTKDNKFCCLGVLCDLVAPEKWNMTSFRYKMATDCSFPPSFVAEPIGLLMDSENSLVAMNDTGKSFPEIADYIEKNL